MSDAVDDLLSAYEARISSVAPTAVAINVGTMFGLSVATVLAFSILRPRNKLLYQPRTKYSSDEKRPPVIDDGLFAWIKPLTSTKEPEMLVEMGLDAVLYLRFLRMCRWLFTVIAVLSCGVLLPVNLVYNVREVQPQYRNFLSQLTIANVKGTALYAHVAMSYIFCFVTFWFIWINYKQAVALKHAYFRSKEYNNSLHARSIMITGVQRQYQTDEGLQKLLGGLGIPYPTSAVHIGRKVGQLPELVEAHNNAVKELEGVLTTYTKGGKLAAKRPTMRIGGFLGCGGKQVDTIDYMTAKIKRLEDRVEQTRETISDRKSEPYGFASFSAVPYAHVVARRLQKKRVKGCVFTLAPLPKDIIWSNLSSFHRSKVMVKFIIALVLILISVLYTIPLVAVSFLANLTAITQYVSFLRVWQTESNWSFSAVVGIAPPILSALLQLLLPVIMRALTRKQGLLTHTQVDRTVFARYWAFLVITQLVIFSLLGVVFNLITELIIEFGKGGDPLGTILREVNKLPARIQYTYLNQSNYWLTWLPLRAWAAVFDLAQVINLFWVWARARLFGRTPREIREWTKPPAFDYAVYSANHLLVAAVAFVYAPLVPLVAVLAAIAFFTASMIYKYQLLFVSVTENESGGRLWRSCVNRVLVCLVFQQLILILTIGLQQGWIRSITCVPPIALIAIYKIVLSKKFDTQYTWFMPTDSEVANAVIHHSDARKHRLQKRFGAPSLHVELFTPLIHQKSQHLLPQIYSGRMGIDDYANLHDINVKRASAAGLPETTGGLQFKAVQEENLELSREAYLQEANDRWETESMSTAVAGGETPLYRGDRAQDYFDQKKRDYLANGPSRSETPTGDYEMSRIPSLPMQGLVRNGDESRENLLYGAAGMAGRGAHGSSQGYAGPGYPPYAGNGHAAEASYENVGMTYGAASSDMYGRAPTYQQVQTPTSHYPPSRQTSPLQQTSARFSPDQSRTDLSGGQPVYGNHRANPSYGSSNSLGKY